MENNFDLKNLIESCDFQKLQDEIAAATKIALITVDYSGKPVTEHSCCSEFCKAVRANPDLKPLCERCDSRGGIEAARIKEPYMYICHMGVVDFAIPIFNNNYYIGAIMCGQFLLPESDTSGIERIIAEQNDMAFEEGSENKFKKLYTLKLSDVKDTIKMISYVCNFRINYALNNASVLPAGFEHPIKRLSKSAAVIQPAIEYIHHNYCSSISLNDMASLCEISSSYFSKLFKKVTKQNLVRYINSIRVKQAEHLLLTTTKSINTIAIDLGFEDCGYFIKVFKKETGVTPNAFRNKLEE